MKIRKPKAITEGDKDILDGWFKEAEKCANAKEVSKFIGHLITDYRHDYGTICVAMVAVAIAAMKCVDHSPQGGITGFQASCIFWEFCSRWGVFGKGPKRLVQYEHMLYPQYENDFAKTITPETAAWLRKTAKERLAEANGDKTSWHPDVLRHMRSVADGVLPFGYTVAER